jgi:hypothetical protein
MSPGVRMTGFTATAENIATRMQDNADDHPNPARTAMTPAAGAMRNVIAVNGMAVERVTAYEDPIGLCRQVMRSGGYLP